MALSKLFLAAKQSRCFRTFTIYTWEKKLGQLNPQKQALGCCSDLRLNLACDHSFKKHFRLRIIGGIHRPEQMDEEIEMLLKVNGNIRGITIEFVGHSDCAFAKTVLSIPSDHQKSLPYYLDALETHRYHILYRWKELIIPRYWFWLTEQIEETGNFQRNLLTLDDFRQYVQKQGYDETHINHRNQNFFSFVRS